VGKDRRAGAVQGALGRRCPSTGNETGSKVVQQQLTHVAAHVTGNVAVGDDLVVGDHHEDLHPGGLQPDPVGQGGEVMTQVQRTGGSVAGKNAEPSRVRSDQLLELNAAVLGSDDRRRRRRRRNRSGGGVGHGSSSVKGAAPRSARLPPCRGLRWVGPSRRGAARTDPIAAATATATRCTGSSARHNDSQLPPDRARAIPGHGAQPATSQSSRGALAHVPAAPPTIPGGWGS
jgi:hypothetical protein